MGCTSPCKELGNRICDCQPIGTVQNTCKKRVTNRLDNANPTSEEESLCEAFLDTCADPNDDSAMCQRLETAQGKADCGIAYSEPAAE